MTMVQGCNSHIKICNRELYTPLFPPGFKGYECNVTPILQQISGISEAAYIFLIGTLNH